MAPELPLSASQAAVVDGVTGIIEDRCAEKRGFLLSGEAGSGKTHVAEWRVLVVTPTARLADVYRQQYDSALVVIDTVDAAYHFWDKNPFWCLPPYTLCILDEVGFLDASRFDRIYNEWIKADREHALLCVGDSQQCAPPGGPLLLRIRGSRSSSATDWIASFGQKTRAGEIYCKVSSASAICSRAAEAHRSHQRGCGPTHHTSKDLGKVPLFCRL